MAAIPLPELAFDPLGQVMSHLDGEVLTVESLHLVQRLPLELLGLYPHGHGPWMPLPLTWQDGKMCGRGGSYSLSNALFNSTTLAHVSGCALNRTYSYTLLDTKHDHFEVH